MSEQTSPLHDPTGARTVPFGRRGEQFHLGEALRELARPISIAIFVAIIALGGYLRLTHVNWDDNDGPWNSNGKVAAVSGHLHPDERFLTQMADGTKAPSSILNYFDTDTSALNPYNINNNGQKQSTYVYGDLPLFMNKFFASHMHVLTLGALPNYDNYDHYNRAGRVLSALFDIATIAVIFLLGRELMNRYVGLLAAFLYAVSAFPIQNAHFFVVDPFVAFFATVAILFAVRSAKHGRLRDMALAGTAAGLAAACKITAISLLPVIVLAIGVYAWPAVKPYVAPLWYGRLRRYEREQNGHRLDAAVGRFALGSVIALAAAFVAFRIAMPYAFKSPDLLDFFIWKRGSLLSVPVLYPDIMSHHWLQDQVDQRNLLAGAAFPPNVQWIGRSKWLWPLQQMVSWGMGPALGITAWLGVIFAIVLFIRKRQGVWLVPLAWVIGYFGFMGYQFSLYMRYFLPLYPTLAVLAAVLLYHVWQWAASGAPFEIFGRFARYLEPARSATSFAARTGVAVVVVLTLLMGLAFYHIYTKPVTRVSASKWVYENVPAGSVIGHEHWDDEVPFNVAGVPPKQYGSVEFKNFDNDSPQHVQDLLSNLDQVDYIALSSERLSGTIPRVPAVWPVTSKYYETLANGELGFEKVAEFDSFPSVLGVTLNDTAAEESYSVYDHPRVVIYKRTDAYSSDKARQVLGADAFVPGVSALPKNLSQNGIEFKPDVLLKQVRGGTWTNIFHPGNVVNDHPLFFWLLAMELAAFALVPLATVVFRGLPDRGFLLTKPLGILGLSYLAYAPASYGLLDFTRGEIAAGLSLMILVGIATGLLWRDEVEGFVRERWRFLLFAEAFFLLLFVGSYWLRMQNPDLWHPARGGEKPMDFAYFNGVLRTTDLTQGPIDPWNAGGYLNYYWFGQFIGATVTKLTGIVPEVAYNLVVPMFFSLAGAATFSLAYNLAEATRRLMKRRPGGLPIGRRGPIIAGVIAVFLVMLSGNLAAVDVFTHNVMTQATCNQGGDHCSGITAFLSGTKAILFGDGSFRRLVYSYDWWGPSRALTVVDPSKEVTPITEFPFWTFLFADLHAHLMAIPFAMTAAAVGLGAVLNFSRINRSDARTKEFASWTMVAIIALIVGALRWINSWDYPSFMVIGAAAVFIGERAKEGRVNLRMLVMGALKCFVMLVLTFVFFAPFVRNYSSAYGSVNRSDQTTDFTDYFSHFGIMLIVMSGFVMFMLLRAVSRSHTFRSAFVRRGSRGTHEAEVATGALVVVGALIVVMACTQRWGVTGLSFVGLVAVAILAWRELRRPTPTAPIMLFVYAMLALGLGLSGGVELFTLDGDIGRMNTVFKFYLHVWMMWGVVGAFGLWYVFAVLRPQESLVQRARAMTPSMPLSAAPRYAFGAIAGIVLLLALVFPYFGTRARIHDRFFPDQGASNNGMDYMDKAVYTDQESRTGKGGEHVLKYDRDGIDWLRENVSGTPTEIEGITPLYHYGSRISIYTGLPTVLGWDWHQSQQRVKFASGIQARMSDVNTFYTTEDVQQARDLLQKYGVQYVVVGDVERNYYPKAGIDKFNSGLGGSLELAYQNPGMQIWHVIPQDQLSATTSENSDGLTASTAP